MFMKTKRIVSLFAIAGFLAATPGHAEYSGRPDTLTLERFQAAPENRWTFSHVREVLPTVNIEHDSQRVLELARSKDFVVNPVVTFQGKRQSLNDIAVHQFIDGLLVIRDGEILVERYFGHLTAERPHLMMSVTKSVVGLLAGKLAEDGVIDLDRTTADYVPELASSGWGPDSLRTLLDMRDGADYTEDYDDMSSTVRLQDCAVGWTDADYCPEDGPRGGYVFYPTVGRDESVLGTFVYKSGTTDALGWVLEAATGEPLAALISKLIWQPMGAEFDANITVDSSGFVLADGGMSSTLRDLGRFGLLVLNEGMALGEQVVPAEFIEDIHAQPGDPDWPYAEELEYGAPYYRSFWWGAGNDGRDIRGLGIHGQVVHVAPAAGMVIVIYSSWPGAEPADAPYGWDATYELIERLVDELG